MSTSTLMCFLILALNLYLLSSPTIILSSIFVSFRILPGASILGTHLRLTVPRRDSNNAHPCSRRTGAHTGRCSWKHRLEHSSPGSSCSKRRCINPPLQANPLWSALALRASTLGSRLMRWEGSALQLTVIPGCLLFVARACSCQTCTCNNGQVDKHHMRHSSTQTPAP